MPQTSWTVGVGVSCFIGAVGGMYLVYRGYKYASKVKELKHSSQHKNEFCPICNTKVDLIADTNWITCINCAQIVCRKPKCSKWIASRGRSEWECQLCHDNRRAHFKASEWLLQQLSKKLKISNVLDLDDISVIDYDTQLIDENDVAIDMNYGRGKISSHQKEYIRAFLEDLLSTLLGGSLDNVLVGPIRKSSDYLPICDHECPGVAHANLKHLIQKIIAEAARLPELLNRSGVPPRPEEHLPYFDPKKYNQLLATAVLNKVVESYHNLRNPLLTKDEYTAGAPNVDLNQNSVKPEKDTKPVENATKSGEQTSPMKLENQTELRSPSAVSMASSSPPAYSDDDENSEQLLETLIKQQKSKSQLPDLTSDETNDDEYLSIKSAATDSTWEDNWMFKSKKLQNDGQSSIAMLIPSPTEEVKVFIGDRTADEISDLSDNEESDNDDEFTNSDLSDTDTDDNGANSSPADIPNVLVHNKTIIGGKHALTEMIENSSDFESLTSQTSFSEAKNDLLIDDGDFVKVDKPLLDIEYSTLDMKNGNVEKMKEAINPYVERKIETDAIETKNANASVVVEKKVVSENVASESQEVADSPVPAPRKSSKGDISAPNASPKPDVDDDVDDDKIRNVRSTKFYPTPIHQLKQKIVTNCHDEDYSIDLIPIIDCGTQIVVHENYVHAIYISSPPHHDEAMLLDTKKIINISDHDDVDDDVDDDDDDEDNDRDHISNDDDFDLISVNSSEFSFYNPRRLNSFNDTGNSSGESKSKSSFAVTNEAICKEILEMVAQPPQDIVVDNVLVSAAYVPTVKEETKITITQTLWEPRMMPDSWASETSSNAADNKNDLIENSLGNNVQIIEESSQSHATIQVEHAKPDSIPVQEDSEMVDMSKEIETTSGRIEVANQEVNELPSTKEQLIEVQIQTTDAQQHRAHVTSEVLQTQEIEYLENTKQDELPKEPKEPTEVTGIIQKFAVMTITEPVCILRVRMEGPEPTANENIQPNEQISEQVTVEPAKPNETIYTIEPYVQNNPNEQNSVIVTEEVRKIEAKLEESATETKPIVEQPVIEVEVIENNSVPNEVPVIEAIIEDKLNVTEEVIQIEEKLEQLTKNDDIVETNPIFEETIETSITVADEVQKIEKKLEEVKLDQTESEPPIKITEEKLGANIFETKPIENVVPVIESMVICEGIEISETKPIQETSNEEIYTIPANVQVKAYEPILEVTIVEEQLVDVQNEILETAAPIRNPDIEVVVVLNGEVKPNNPVSVNVLEEVIKIESKLDEEKLKIPTTKPEEKLIFEIKQVENVGPVIESTIEVGTNDSTSVVVAEEVGKIEDKLEEVSIAISETQPIQETGNEEMYTIPADDQVKAYEPIQELTKIEEQLVDVQSEISETVSISNPDIEIVPAIEPRDEPKPNVPISIPEEVLNVDKKVPEEKTEIPENKPFEEPIIEAIPAIELIDEVKSNNPVSVNIIEEVKKIESKLDEEKLKISEIKPEEKSISEIKPVENVGQAIETNNNVETNEPTSVVVAEEVRKIENKLEEVSIAISETQPIQETGNEEMYTIPADVQVKEFEPIQEITKIEEQLFDIQNEISETISISNPDVQVAPAIEPRDETHPNGSVSIVEEVQIVEEKLLEKKIEIPENKPFEETVIEAIPTIEFNDEVKITETKPIQDPAKENIYTIEPYVQVKPYDPISIIVTEEVLKIEEQLDTKNEIHETNPISDPNIEIVPAIESHSVIKEIDPISVIVIEEVRKIEEKLIGEKDDVPERKVIDETVIEAIPSIELIDDKLEDIEYAKTKSIEKPENETVDLNVGIVPNEILSKIILVPEPIQFDQINESEEIDKITAPTELESSVIVNDTFDRRANVLEIQMLEELDPKIHTIDLKEPLDINNEKVEIGSVAVIATNLKEVVQKIDPTVEQVVEVTKFEEKLEVVEIVPMEISTGDQKLEEPIIQTTDFKEHLAVIIEKNEEITDEPISELGTKDEEVANLPNKKEFEATSSQLLPVELVEQTSQIESTEISSSEFVSVTITDRVQQIEEKLESAVIEPQIQTSDINEPIEIIEHNIEIVSIEKTEITENTSSEQVSITITKIETPIEDNLDDSFIEPKIQTIDIKKFESKLEVPVIELQSPKINATLETVEQIKLVEFPAFPIMNVPNQSTILQSPEPLQMTVRSEIEPIVESQSPVEADYEVITEKEIKSIPVHIESSMKSSSLVAKLTTTKTSTISLTLASETFVSVPVSPISEHVEPQNTAVEETSLAMQAIEQKSQSRYSSPLFKPLLPSSPPPPVVKITTTKIESPTNTNKTSSLISSTTSDSQPTKIESHTNTNSTSSLISSTTNDNQPTNTIVDGDEVLSVDVPLPGSIAEREHKKWENAAPIANNPYSAEVLQRRLSQKSHDGSTFKIIEPPHPIENGSTPVQEKHLVDVFKAELPAHKRFGRDYYINEAKKASGERLRRSELLNRQLHHDSTSSDDHHNDETDYQNFLYIRATTEQFVENERQNTTEYPLQRSKSSGDTNHQVNENIFAARPIMVEVDDPILAKAHRIEALSTDDREFFLLPIEEAQMNIGFSSSEASSLRSPSSLSEDSDTARIYNLRTQETKKVEPINIPPALKPKIQPKSPSVLQARPSFGNAAAPVPPPAKLDVNTKLMSKSVPMIATSSEFGQNNYKKELPDEINNNIAIEEEIKYNLPSVKSLAKAFTETKDNPTPGPINKPKTPWHSASNLSKPIDKEVAPPKPLPEHSIRPGYSISGRSISKQVKDELREVTASKPLDSNNNQTISTITINTKQQIITPPRTPSPTPVPGALRSNIAFFENLKNNKN